MDEFLDEMEGLVAHLPQHERLVSPVLTPRFVPTCSDELLRGLAGISRDRNILVQSHMCESRDQMAWVESTRGKADEVVFDEVSSRCPGLMTGGPAYSKDDTGTRYVLPA